MIITRNKNSFLLRLLVKLLHHQKNNKKNGDVLFGDLGVYDYDMIKGLNVITVK